MVGSSKFPVDLRFQRLIRNPFGAQPEGVPRSEVGVPISPSGSLSDSVVYEDAADPAHLLHLPRFRVRRSQTSHDIRFTPTATGRWSLRFGVEPYAAEELGDHQRTPALAFSVSAAALSYAAPPLDKRIEASEVLPDADGFTIGFDVDLPGRDEVLWAISSEGGIRLSLSRSFTVAVPVVSAPSAPVGAVEVVGGDLRLLHAIPVQLADDLVPQIFVPIEIAEPPVVEHQPEPIQPEVVLHHEAIVQPEVVMQPEIALHTTVFAPQMAFLANPGVVHQLKPTVAEPAAGVMAHMLHLPLAKLSAADTAVSVADEVVGGPRLIPLKRKFRPEGLELFRDLTFDPGRVIVTEPAGDPTPETRYRVTPTVLVTESVIRLQPAAHPDLFGGVDTQAPAFRSVRFSYPPEGPGSRSHVYFQDERHPNVFFYLPDEFVLGRTESLPIRPALVFRVEQGEVESEARATVTVRLRPRVVPARLEAAAVELDRLIPPPLAGESRAAVTLEPVQADSVLTLALPAGGELDVPPLDLVNGFVAEVEFPFAQFQDVFASLASADEIATLMRGTVEVGIEEGDGARTTGRALVPVDIRFGSAGGDVLTVAESATTGGGVALTVRNSSESPVRIDGLPVRMTRGGAMLTATTEGLSLPLELAAGAEISFVVKPTAPAEGGDGELDVLVDVTQVVPLPDAQAILALTLDQRIAQMSARTVTVLTTANKLAGEGDTVHDVFVEFDSGLGAPSHVNAEQLQTTARVPVPLVDVLLRRDSGPYRFRQTVLRASGDQRDAEWRTSDASLLVVPVV